MQKPQMWPSRIFRNLPNKCGEGKSGARVKGPRWTEQRLQYILFRVHYITPPVTSRGIPELLNHCGPWGREGGAGPARRGGGPRPAPAPPPPQERTLVHPRGSGGGSGDRASNSLQSPAPCDTAP